MNKLWNNMKDLWRKIPWNNNINILTKLSFLFIGATLFYFCTKYFFTYNESEYSFRYLAMIFLALYQVIGLFFIITIFDFSNKAGKIVLYGILSAFIIFMILKKVALIWLILLVCAILVFIAVKVLENVLVTLLSFSVLGLICAFCSLICIQYIGLQNYAAIIIYLIMTLYILIYKLIGLKINHFLLFWFFISDSTQSYDEKHFNNLLIFIYFAVFAGINVGLYSSNIGDTWFNLINNSFLTAFIIMQLDWKNIFRLEEI